MGILGSTEINSFQQSISNRCLSQYQPFKMKGFSAVPLFVYFLVGITSAVDIPDVLSTYNFDLDRIDNPDLTSKIDKLFERGVIPLYFRELLSEIEQDETVVNDLLDQVSQPCRDHTQAWIQALLTNITHKSNSWALQMIDAWPKVPEGILSGHTTVFGDFDECLGVRAQFPPTDNFKGKYCTSYIFPFDPSSMMQQGSSNEIRQSLDLDEFINNHLYAGMDSMQASFPTIGSCYPSSCSQVDVSLLLQNTFNKTIPALGGSSLVPVVMYCTTDDAPKLNGGDIAMVSILAVLAALCVLATALDLTVDSQSSTRNGYAIQAVLAFSLYTNTKKWLNTKSGGGENFSCMHGIRFLSTCWVVLGHTFSLTTFMNTWNIVDMKRIYNSNWTLFSVLNGTVSVDTFFTMSGLLFAYNMLKVLQKSKGTINIPMMYLHRFLRLTPTYALLIGIVATFYAYLGNGPGWSQVVQTSSFCRKNWWHNLLYINNLMSYDPSLPDDGMCHAEAWYLANDMQFFLISPLLIYPIFKWKNIGLALLGLVTVASIAIPVTIHATETPTLMPTLLTSRPFGNFFQDSYSKPWMRFGPYAVGLWAGFILFQTADKKINIPKLAVAAGWLISTGTALAILFGIIPWYDPETEIPVGLAAFYAGVHRFAWGVVISWIIFACTRGYGGPVNTFLSWKVFVPLGRLTFCVYLMSYTLQSLYMARVRQPAFFDIYGSTNLFFAHLVMSCLIGFVCCITMESPFIALEKLIFQGPTKVTRTERPAAEINDKDEKI